MLDRSDAPLAVKSAFGFSFHPELPIVFLEFHGELSVDSTVQAIERVVSSSLWRPGMAFHTDLRDARLSLVKLPQVIGFREQIDSLLGDERGPVVFVVSRVLEYGVCRMYQTLARDGADRIGIFWDYQAALQWVKQRKPQSSSCQIPDLP